MTIDASGRVTMPYQPYFHASGTLGGTTVSTGILSFTDVYRNIGNHYNSSTSLFTAPVSGNYFVSAGLLTYPTADTNEKTLSISINGNTEYRYGFQRSKNISQTSREFSRVIYLSAGDYIGVHYETTGATTWVYTDNWHGHFTGYLLG